MNETVMEKFKVEQVGLGLNYIVWFILIYDPQEYVHVHVYFMFNRNVNR